MDSNFDLLIDQCKIFKKSVESLKIGAKSHQNIATVEEKVIQLKQLNHFLNSKLQVVKVDSLKDKTSSNHDDISQTKDDLIDKVCKEQIRERMLRTLYTGKIIEELKNNSEPSPEIKLYKQKISEQLINLNIINNEIKKKITIQQNVLQETLTLKMELKKAQVEYKKKLAEQKAKSSKDKDNRLSIDYKDKLETTEKRVSKINFMRVLISRLLIYSGIDWSKNKEFLPLFERMRLPVTLEDFKKNSLEHINNLEK